MLTATIIFLVLCAYLLGSASSAILLCRLYYGADIRESGSGNPGANNVQRIYGWKMGVAVFLIDFMKGAGAVAMAHLTPIPPGTESFVSLQIGLGSAAMLGHIFPLFFRFKGGKGVSILCGILAAIHPWAMLICFSIFLIVFFISRYISLSVLIAILFYPIMINSLFALWLIPEETLTLKIFSGVAAAVIWLCHLSNISRLIHHTEEKFSFRRAVHRTTERRKREI